MPTTTPNLQLTLPTPDVDTGWGTTLNTDFTKIDDIFASGGTGTGVGMRIGSGKTLTMSGTMILGSGDNTSNPVGANIRGPAASSGTSNKTGATLYFSASNGTGNGGSGPIVFQTAPPSSSGTSPNTLRNSFVLYNAGNVAFDRNTDGDIFTAYGPNGNIACAEFSSVSYLRSNVLPLNFGTASNSNLLIVTNNTERMRIAANGSLGFAGANYGTAGQVVTSNGNSGPPSWQDTKALTTESSQSLVGTTNVDFGSILSSAEMIQIVFHRVVRGATNNILIRLGDSGGFENTGYKSWSQYTTATTGEENDTGIVIYNTSATSEITGTVTISRMYGDLWDCSYSLVDTVGKKVIVGGGYKTLSGTLTQVQVIRQGTGNFTSGNVRMTYFK